MSNRTGRLSFVDMLDKALTAITQLFVVACFVAMVLLVIAAVVFRYVLVDPLSWSDQLAKYLMVWTSFLAASLGVRRGAHVSFELLDTQLKGSAQKFVRQIAFISTLLFLSVISYQGVLFTFRVRNQFDPLVFELSLAIPYAAIPVGFALMSVQLVLGYLRPGQYEKELGV